MNHFCLKQNLEVSNVSDVLIKCYQIKQAIIANFGKKGINEQIFPFLDEEYIFGVHTWRC